jgi:hypothetical protein
MRDVFRPALDELGERNRPSSRVIANPRKILFL